MPNILSIRDFTHSEIFDIFKLTDQLKKKPEPSLLKGKILANCFFEPSTRTRLSFEVAMLKLGGQVTNFVDLKSTSSSKGESLRDTLKVIGGYVDVIVLRHPKEGASRLAQEISPVPIINAGDGSNQHPTQTLLDLYTIHEAQKNLEGLHVALSGDLKYGRTVHSFAYIAHLFNMRLYFISPPGLEMPDAVLKELRNQKVKFSIHQELEDILPRLDVLYMTRVQKERLGSTSLKEDTEETMIVTKNLLKGAKKNLQILHPLPRNQEIHPSVDETPFASYFQQAQNGLYIREALLASVLGAKT